MLLIYFIPILIVAILVLSKTTHLLGSGIIALVVTYGVTIFSFPDLYSITEFTYSAILKGAWLSWQAIAVIITGLLFHHSVKRLKPELFKQSSDSDEVNDYHSVFNLCFLIGPFFESVTGFGVGLVIVLPFLLSMRISKIVAIVFALYSQLLVPWGALSIGTSIGATLAHLDGNTLGVYSTIVSSCLMSVFLLFFWYLYQKYLEQINLSQKISDIFWLVILMVCLFLSNYYLTYDMAGVISTGFVFILRVIWYAKLSISQWLAHYFRVWPYAILALTMLATRLFPEFSAYLKSAYIIQYLDGPIFNVFYHASFWLFLMSVIVVFRLVFREHCVDGFKPFNVIAEEVRSLFKQAYDSAKTPVLVTFIFVIIAQCLLLAQPVNELASLLVSKLGGASLAVSILLAVCAGVITGSNVASNALFMPLQSELSLHLSISNVWLASLQNSIGSTFTLFSPIRIAMACALTGMLGKESLIYQNIIALFVALIFLSITMSYIILHFS